MQKQIYIFSFILFFVVFSACKDIEKYNNVETFSWDDIPEMKYLEAEDVLLDDLIMVPGRMLIVDSILFIQNRNSSYLVCKYNLNTGKKIGEDIPFGSGPDDMLAIQQMIYINSIILITDGQKRTLFEYDKKEFCTQDKTIPKNKIKTEDFLQSISILPDGKIVASTMNPYNKRLLIFNQIGEMINSYGEYPEYNRELTDIEKLEGFVSNITFNPTNQSICIFNMQTDLIEIYNTEGTLIKRWHGPQQFFPRMRETKSADGSSRVRSAGEPTDAYLEPIQVKDEVFVSFAGENRIPTRITPVNHILVFDKENNPARHYLLSHSIIRFAVDPENRYIYASCIDPEYKIIRFKY